MSELIEMTKDGETIHVSPLTLENHLQLGWKKVGGEPASEEEQDAAEKKAAELAEKKRLAAEKKAAAGK